MAEYQFFEKDYRRNENKIKTTTAKQKTHNWSQVLTQAKIFLVGQILYEKMLERILVEKSGL